MLQDIPGTLEDLPGTNYKGIAWLGEKELFKMYKGPVWLMNFPHILVPFYQKKMADGMSKMADLILSDGEVMGLGERHSDESEIQQSLLEHAVKESEVYNWYKEIRKDSLQTSGFSLGKE